MAIYNVEYLSESKKNDDLLDNMLEACDAMMAMLDEHGGARNRYVAMKEKERDYNRSMRDYYKGVSDSMSGNASREALKKSDDYNKKAFGPGGPSDQVRRYTGTDRFRSNNGKNGIEFIKNASDTNSRGSISDYRKSKDGKDAFMKDFGGKKGEDLVHKNPGEIKALQDKKRAIKETCLNILSIIDEL